MGEPSMNESKQGSCIYSGCHYNMLGMGSMSVDVEATRILDQELGS